MIVCWNCGHRMALVTDGNGQLVRQCGNCGRTSKPLPPKRKPGQSDSPYRDSVSGASGNGNRDRVSGAVRTRADKPRQLGIRGRAGSGSIYGVIHSLDVLVRRRTPEARSCSAASSTLPECPFGVAVQPSGQPSPLPTNAGGAP
jgi:predicted  nucleic acid-binding Zn-ribbon protein